MKMYKSDNIKNLDEREKKITEESLALSAVVAFIYLILSIIYKIIFKGGISSIIHEHKIIGLMMAIGLISYYTIGKLSELNKDVVIERFTLRFDERIKSKLIRSLSISAIIPVFYSLFILALELYFTKSLNGAYNFIGLLVIMVITSFAYNIINKEYILPTTLTGKKIPIKDFEKSKKIRIKHYLKNTIPLATIFLILNIISPEGLEGLIVPMPLFGSKVLSYALSFILSFILLFIIDYLWNEYNIKKHNNFIKSLDDEENLI